MSSNNGSTADRDDEAANDQNNRTLAKLKRIEAENPEPPPPPEEAEARRVLQTMGRDLIATLWNPDFPNTARFLTHITPEMFEVQDGWDAKQKDVIAGIINSRVWAEILNYHEKTGEVPTRQITRDLLLKDLTEDDPYDEILAVCDYKGDYRNADYIKGVLDETFDKLKQREHYERVFYGEAAQQALSLGDFATYEQIIRTGLATTPISGEERFKFLTPSEINKIETEERTYLVDGLFEARKATVWGGSKKSFKTATLCDLIVSLATATPFLNRWPVTTSRTVCFVSAESDETDIGPRYRSIAESKGVDLPDDRIHTLFGAPKLSDASELQSLVETAKNLGAEVLIIDPLYLTLLRGGSSKKQAGNLYDMGEALAGVGDLCRETGITPILCHHTRKTNTVGCDLDDLTFSGPAEWARQSLMIKMKGNPVNGVSTLILRTHGFARTGLYELTIDEGIWPDLKWHVNVQDATEADLANKRTTLDQQVTHLQQAFVDIAETEATPIEHMWCSKRQLRDEIGCSGDKITKIVQHAIESGFVEVREAGTNQARYRRIK